MADKDKIISDAEIIELYFQRCESAIRQTEKKYGKYLYTVAYNILRSNEDSEECVSDTYLKTWNAIPPTRPTVLRSFLAKITRGVALDRYDIKKSAKRVPEDAITSLSEIEAVMSDFSDLQSDLDTREIGRIITEYIDSLSDRRTYIFLSRYFFARKIDEIASKLLCSRSSVNKELTKMKNELKEKLQKEGVLL